MTTENKLEKAIKNLRSIYEELGPEGGIQIVNGITKLLESTLKKPSPDPPKNGQPDVVIKERVDNGAIIFSSGGATEKKNFTCPNCGKSLEVSLKLSRS